MPPSIRYQKVIQYFLQGLLILGPATITVYAIYVVFDKTNVLLHKTYYKLHRYCKRDCVVRIFREMQSHN